MPAALYTIRSTVYQATQRDHKTHGLPLNLAMKLREVGELIRELHVSDIKKDIILNLVIFAFSKDCEPSRFWIVARHAERNPNIEEIIMMRDLASSSVRMTNKSPI